MNKLFIFVSLISCILFSQENQENSEQTSNILFSINHAFQIPGGDLSDRFGYNSDISLSTLYRSNNNFTINLEGGFLFGPTVKENNIFNAIDGDDDELISQNGEIPTIRFFERGAHLDISVGKYFPISTKNNESGIIASIGTGYIYHKILIETIVTELPQLNEELLKGYDRLCGGMLIKQFVGYFYFSQKNNIRFFLGLEAVQAFTKDLREYSYTTQSYINTKRIDHLIGLKCGFMIPIKKRNTGKYYYF